MQVGGLGAVAVGLPGHGEPAAVLGITQGPAEGGDAVVHQSGITRQALDMGHGEAVGHARGVHGFGLGAAGQAALFIEVAKARRKP